MPILSPIPHRRLSSPTGSTGSTGSTLTLSRKCSHCPERHAEHGALPHAIGGGGLGEGAQGQGMQQSCNFCSAKAGAWEQHPGRARPPPRAQLALAQAASGMGADRHYKVALPCRPGWCRAGGRCCRGRPFPGARARGAGRLALAACSTCSQAPPRVLRDCSLHQHATLGHPAGAAQGCPRSSQRSSCAPGAAPRVLLPPPVQPAQRATHKTRPESRGKKSLPLAALCVERLARHLIAQQLVRRGHVSKGRLCLLGVLWGGAVRGCRRVASTLYALCTSRCVAEEGSPSVA